MYSNVSASLTYKDARLFEKQRFGSSKPTFHSPLDQHMAPKFPGKHK